MFFISGGKKMRVHDAHTHIFPDKIAARATKSIGDFYEFDDMQCSATSDNLLKREENIHSGMSLVCSSAVTKEQVDVINSFIANECKKHPEFLGFAALHPDTKNFEEVLDFAEENNLRGIKFHPDFQEFNIDDKRAYDIYKAIAKRNLPVLFHMGDPRYDFSAPKRLQRVMADIPDLKVIAAHFGGYCQWNEALKLEKSDNLYFDTSSSLPFMEKEAVFEFFNKFGTDKFMFGTDFPMWDSKEELERFLSLELNDEDNNKILHENFEKLFNIKSFGGN